jgi:chemotaxis protein MotB
VLFNKQDPRAPVNRRISIIVMTRQAEQDALKTEAAPEMTLPAAPAQ